MLLGHADVARKDARAAEQWCADATQLTDVTWR